MKTQVAKKISGAGNRKKISDAVMWIVVIAIIAFVIIFFFPEPLSEEVYSFSGYHCFSQTFICSQNISYSSTGQISLNLRQKVTYPAIYNVSFLCTSYNSTITSFTKFGSGFLNTTKATMPYNVTVHASGIRCYNSTGAVYIGPNTTFKGILFANFYTKNGTRNIIDAAAITIIRKG